MKLFKQFAAILALSLLVSACATVPAGTDEKYNFDGQLEPVTEILKYNLMSWDAIDSRSLILQTAPSRFYLVILIQPADRLVFTESIKITNTGSMVKPGYDKVIVPGPPYTESFIIDKIYKLEDRDQKKAIKEQLKGK
jgi:hypothetical protein